MSNHPAFILINDNLTFDPLMPNLCTDEDHICYGTVKVPVPTGGGGGGGGGGFISGAPIAPYVPCEMEQDLFGKLRSVRCRPEIVSAFARAIAKKIQGEIARESGKYSPADPLAVPRTMPPEKVREADLRKLRYRIQQLEAQAAQVNNAHTAEAAALAETIAELQRLVVELQEKVESLRSARIPLQYRIEHKQASGAIETEQQAEAAVEATLGGVDLENFIADKVLSATLAAATEPERVRTALAKDRLPGLWKLIGAAGLYFVVDRIEEPAWVRTAGFGGAVLLGVAGLADLLGVQKEEDKT